MSMRIDDNILNQIYLSQNYGAQPLESEGKEIKEPKSEGRKTEGDKSLEDRSVFQVNGKEYNLTSADFRVALYEYAKGQDSLKGELDIIRHRLGLTDKGEALTEPNKALDTRSVINEIFARPENVQAKVDAALAGVVKFPKEVQTEIHHAIWRQRDNPGIRKFLLSGGSGHDLAAICNLTLKSMEANGNRNFGHRKAMSYLKGFTSVMAAETISFSKDFEKSFEEDELFRWEQRGVKDGETVKLNQLDESFKGAFEKLEKQTKDLFAKLKEDETTVGGKYLKARYEEFERELRKQCETDKQNLKALDVDERKRNLDSKVDEFIQKLTTGELKKRANHLDMLAKFKFDPDALFSEMDAVANQQHFAVQSCYKAVRKQFIEDYQEATQCGTGAMWAYLSDLKENELTVELLTKIFSGPDYFAGVIAFNAAKPMPEDGLPKNENYYDQLKDPKDYFTAEKKNGIKQNLVFRQRKLSNTCYMTSFVNGLLMKGECVNVLKNCVQEKKENEVEPLFKFNHANGSEISVTRSEIEAQKVKEGFTKEDADYSDFEWALHIAQFKFGAQAVDASQSGLVHMQDQLTLAEVFGYTQDCGAGFSKGDVKSAVAAWTKMKRVMDTTPDAILSVKTGGQGEGHYMTVTGFYKTKDDFGVTVIDSTGDKKVQSMKNFESNVLSLHAYRPVEKSKTESDVRGLIENFSTDVKSCGRPLEEQKEIVKAVLAESKVKISGNENSLLSDVFLAEEPDKFGNVTFDVRKIATTELEPAEKDMKMSKKDLVGNLLVLVTNALLAKNRPPA